LLSAVPIPSPDAESAREVRLLEGEVPSPLDPPTGCPFHPRCPDATPECASTMPPLKEEATGHSVACHLYDNNRLEGE